MKLGVFDSGVGGKALAIYLGSVFPEATIQVVNDHENVPYGSKTAQQIIKLTDAAIQPLLKDACDVIVIACNSATMAAIDELRRRYPSQKFIGLEPMVKPAALLTKTGTIAVCATPATLASKRYSELKQTYAANIVVIEPDCSDWAGMIESNHINEASITITIESAIDSGADVIVLGCTHYHWIKEMISTIAAGRAVVLEPSEAVARRIRTLLPDSTASAEPAPIAVSPVSA